LLNINTGNAHKLTAHQYLFLFKQMASQKADLPVKKQGLKKLINLGTRLALQPW